MRKIICIVGLLCLVLFTGCAQPQSIGIEDYVWQMSSIQSAGKNGAAVAYGPEGSSTLEGAVELDMVCEAAGGVLSLTDKTNGKAYTGTYSKKQANPESVIYEIEITENHGYGTAGLTEYKDGTTRPTLILAVGDHSINFFADTGKITE